MRVLLCLLVLNAVATLAAAQEWRRAPDEVWFKGGRPSNKHFGLSFATVLDSVSEDGKRVEWARGAEVWLDYISPLAKVNFGADFKIRFPDLRKGDIVCAFNGLYTVDEVSPDEDRPSVLFKRLSADNVPRGVTFRPNTIVVPLSTTGKYGQLQMYERGLGLRSIGREKDKKGEPGRWVAHTIEFMPIYEGYAEHKAQLKEGDILLFAGKGHRVLGIVPRDEKTRVIGWMELEAVPVGTEEEMKKKKIAFVRPTPPRELPKLDPKRDR